eukprot:758244-Rhodomonas_salina.1
MCSAIHSTDNSVCNLPTRLPGPYYALYRPKICAYAFASTTPMRSAVLKERVALRGCQHRDRLLPPARACPVVKRPF